MEKRIKILIAILFLFCVTGALQAQQPIFSIDYDQNMTDAEVAAAVGRAEDNAHGTLWMVRPLNTDLIDGTVQPSQFTCSDLLTWLQLLLLRDEFLPQKQTLKAKMTSALLLQNSR